MYKRISLLITCLISRLITAQSILVLEPEQQIWADVLGVSQTKERLITLELSYRQATNYEWNQVLGRVRYGVMKNADTRIDYGLAFVASNFGWLQNNEVEFRPYAGWRQVLYGSDHWKFETYLRNEFILFPELGFPGTLNRVRIRPQASFITPIYSNGIQSIMLSADVEYLEAWQLSKFESKSRTFRYRARIRLDFTNSLKIEGSYFYENAPWIGLQLRHVYRIACLLEI